MATRSVSDSETQSQRVEIGDIPSYEEMIANLNEGVEVPEEVIRASANADGENILHHESEDDSSDGDSKVSEDNLGFQDKEQHSTSPFTVSPTPKFVETPSFRSVIRDRKRNPVRKSMAFQDPQWEPSYYHLTAEERRILKIHSNGKYSMPTEVLQSKGNPRDVPETLRVAIGKLWLRDAWDNLDKYYPILSIKLLLRFLPSDSSCQERITCIIAAAQNIKLHKFTADLISDVPNLDEGRLVSDLVELRAPLSITQGTANSVFKPLTDRIESVIHSASENMQATAAHSNTMTGQMVSATREHTSALQNYSLAMTDMIERGTGQKETDIGKLRKGTSAGSISSFAQSLTDKPQPSASSSSTISKLKPLKESILQYDDHDDD